jgi:8-oxo-dGTP diphosphatase
MTTNNENNIILETVLNIFTVEDGKLKILLEKKTKEPYKGYWILPAKNLKSNETLEEARDNILEESIGTTEIYTEQHYMFSKIDRNPNKRVIAASYIGLVDTRIVKINEEKEIKWFDIEELPKVGFDNLEIIERARKKLKKQIEKSDIIIKLFPSDFTLPELQSVFESIMNKKIDRRNFRKKFLTLNLIEETGYKNASGSGRPAKLYRFKENIKEINIF